MKLLFFLSALVLLTSCSVLTAPIKVAGAVVEETVDITKSVVSGGGE